MDDQKVMDILDDFEIKALEDIELDRSIDADNYESFGKYNLIKKIKKRIGEALNLSGKEEITNVENDNSGKNHGHGSQDVRTSH